MLVCMVHDVSGCFQFSGGERWEKIVYPCITVGLTCMYVYIYNIDA